jgi:hypothetical protein
MFVEQANKEINKFKQVFNTVEAVLTALAQDSVKIGPILKVEPHQCLTESLYVMSL